MKAAVIEANRTLATRQIDMPSLPKGGALIRVSACGVCGSDLDKLLYRSTPEGTVLGHEVVGRMAILSEEAKIRFPQLQEGQRVCVAHHVPCQTCHYCQHGSPSMCRTFKKTNIIPGGFAEHIAVSADHLAYTVFALPDDISDQAASCMEPLACCIRAVERIPPQSGGQAFIIGLGFIGLLTSQYLGLKHYATLGIDLKPERIELAKQHHLLDDAFTEAEAAVTHLKSQTGGRGADVVFLSVVNTATLDLAFRSIRDGGILVLFASDGANQPILDQNQLYFREIAVIPSYSPSLADLKRAFDCITQHQVKVESLVTNCYSLEELPQAMEAYRTGAALKALITL